MLVLGMIAVGLCLSFANGANDNLKGVATLWGSGTASYRQALWWATVSTFCGSVTAAWLAESLLTSFSGKGLVANDVVARPEFAAAVAGGAGLTVWLATRWGWPISTTHSLLGALVGAGIAAGSVIDSSRLLGAFVLPLLLSPLLALIVTATLYPLLHSLRQRWGIVPESCFCLESAVPPVVSAESGALAASLVAPFAVQIGTVASCGDRSVGRLLGLRARSLLDLLHYGSAGLVCFARGLNDTPKIAAVILVGVAAEGLWPILLVGLSMAAGGILGGRRIADTMSRRITEMDHGEGFTANVLSGVIVVVASLLGAPVSTTHVMCGSLFGIGAVNRRAHWRSIGAIAAAWLITLPVGMALGAVALRMILWMS